jgi:hypothetical protein
MPITNNIIQTHKNKISTFVETGSWLGDGIQQALDNSFDVIYSVEINEESHNKCKKRFVGNDNINLTFSSTEDFFKEIIIDNSHPLNNERCFIYLDAHSNCTAGRFKDINDVAPVLTELELISKLKINNHIIVVDDFRYMRNYNKWAKKFSGMNMKEELKQRFLNINSNYIIRYEPDSLDVEDLVVAFTRD